MTISPLSAFATGGGTSPSQFTGVASGAISKGQLCFMNADGTVSKYKPPRSKAAKSFTLQNSAWANVQAGDYGNVWLASQNVGVMFFGLASGSGGNYTDYAYAVAFRFDETGAITFGPQKLVATAGNSGGQNPQPNTIPGGIIADQANNRVGLVWSVGYNYQAPNFQWFTVDPVTLALTAGAAFSSVLPSTGTSAYYYRQNHGLRMWIDESIKRVIFYGWGSSSNYYFNSIDYNTVTNGTLQTAALASNTGSGGYVSSAPCYDATNHRLMWFGDNNSNQLGAATFTQGGANPARVMSSVYNSINNQRQYTYLCAIFQDPATGTIYLDASTSDLYPVTFSGTTPSLGAATGSNFWDQGGGIGAYSGWYLDGNIFNDTVNKELTYNSTTWAYGTGSYVLTTKAAVPTVASYSPMNTAYGVWIYGSLRFTTPTYNIDVNVIGNPPRVLLGLSKGELLGVATATVANGASITVDVWQEGKITKGNFSGLTPGQVYRHDKDGNLTKLPVHPLGENPTIGVALSATDMLMKAA